MASVWSLSQIYMAETTGSFVTGEGAFVSTSLLAWFCLSFALRLAPVDFSTLFAIVEGASASSALLPALVGLPIVLGLPGDLDWGGMPDSLPSLLMPNQRIASLATLGGAPIPFAAVLPSLLFAIAVNSIIWVSISAQMFLLRDRLYSLKTISYPVPSATHRLVGEALSDRPKRGVSATVLSGFSLGFLLVSLTQGYLSSMFLNDFFLLPAGFTGPIYAMVKEVLPGGLLGFDIMTTVPYIWFLLFVPSSITATVSITAAIYYLVLLPLEFQLNVIPEQYLNNYGTLFSASRSLGLSSLWMGMGLFLASSAGIFIETARTSSVRKEELPVLATFLIFAAPPVLLAWVWGGSAVLLAVVLVMALLTASAWSSRGLAELNLAYAPSDVIVGSTWPIMSRTFGIGQGFSKDSVSFFLVGYLSVASTIGGATSLESVKFGELLNQRHHETFSYFILGSLLGLLLGSIFYLWLVFRLGVQSRILGGYFLGMVEQTTGVYSAYSYLSGQVSPPSVDLSSLLMGGLVGLGLPLLLSLLRGMAISPYALAIGVFMSPATTIIPYAFISALRRLLFERQGEGGDQRTTSNFVVGVASGAISAALLSTVLSTLS